MHQTGTNRIQVRLEHSILGTLIKIHIIGKHISLFLVTIRITENKTGVNYLELH
jgi:hypothetical protein